MRKRSIKLFLIILFVFYTFHLFSFQAGSFHASYWNGIILVDNGKIYGFRFAFEKNGKIADGYDTFFLVEKPGLIAQDYSYAEVYFNTNYKFGLRHKTPIEKKNIRRDGILKLVYGKYGTGVIGYIKIPENVKIILKFYSPWGMGEKVKFENGFVVSEKGDFVFKKIGGTLKSPETDGSEMNFKISGERFYFYAGFEDFNNDSAWIEAKLESAKKKYEKRRVKFKGEFEGLISSITTNLYWMKLLQPDKGRLYIPAGRRWIFPGKNREYDLWTMFEWDSFFNAIELSVEDERLAKTEIEAVLDTQYRWGNIPNWRSATAGSTDRAQPPVGAFAVLKVFYKTGDLELLRKSYERLVKFHKYWTDNIGKHLKRDGNNNFLFEWGSDTELVNKVLPSWEVGASGRTRAAWESGQDDLPNYDNVKFNEKTHSIELDCVDLSSLLALDSYSLFKIAKILGKTSDSEFFKNEYEKISKKINKLLWNDKKSFYFDRYWSGKFSKAKASSNFYPLLAGVATKERAKKLLAHLLNPSEFWGDYIIPTISRDNPAFKDQQYWRGTIWPPTNYLVYQGLKRYGFDEIAAEFARKSAKLFLRSWKEYGLCRENYNSVTGEGGGQRYQSWGPLFALVLIEDFIDNSPFDGLRVGNFAAYDKNTLLNYKIKGDSYDLFANKNSLTLYKNSKKVLSYRGRAVLRNLKINNDFVEADISVYSDSLNFIPSSKKWKLYVDGKSVFSSFKLKKGKHRIRILRGEN